MSISKEQLKLDLETLHTDINDCLHVFVHGDEEATVPLGGEETDSLRRMVKKVNDAQNDITEEIKGYAKEASDSAKEATERADEIKSLKVHATTLEPGASATATYNPMTGTMEMGVPKGDKGEQGEPGKDGTGVNILDAFDDVSELPAAGQPGDGYMVGRDLYVWSVSENGWKNAGPIQGEKGNTGDKGDQGDQGPPGSDATVPDATPNVAGKVMLAEVGNKESIDKAETPAGAQDKADKAKADAINSAKAYTDEEITKLPKGGGFNTRRVITTTSTFSVPVTGWYEVMCIGGGHRGGNGLQNYSTGGGGGAGEVVADFIYLEKGQTVSVTIGSGSGGTTSFGTYLNARGGNVGTYSSTSQSGVGGAGYPAGENGRVASTGINVCGANGGDNGTPYGGGGGGGSSSNVANTGGKPGGNGTAASGINSGNGGPGAVILKFNDPDKG